MAKIFPRKFMFLISDEIYYQLRTLAMQEHLSMGGLLRKLISDAFIQAASPHLDLLKTG